MKKIVSLLLAAIMFLILIPMPVDATQEQEAFGQEELISIACEVFPEYKDRILTRQNFNGSSRSAPLNRELVVTETRNISDNDAVVYSEYSDGMILLAYYDYSYSTTINSQVQEGSRTNYDVTIRATSVEVENAYFELRNINFTIFGTTYDRISSVGTYVEYGRCVVHTQFPPVLIETATEKAYIMYRLSWQVSNISGGWITSVLRIEVGGNAFRVIHLDFEEYVDNYGLLS